MLKVNDFLKASLWKFVNLISHEISLFQSILTLPVYKQVESLYKTTLKGNNPNGENLNDSFFRSNDFSWRWNLWENLQLYLSSNSALPNLTDVRLFLQVWIVKK